jgi:hypothetical protein
MKWYVVKLVFQIICGEGQHRAQFDEQLRLIKAGNEDEAFELATELGTNEADSFYNQRNQLVQWKFINICELYELSLIEGAELHSKISEADEAVDYISLVNAKAEHIKEKHSHKLLHLL